MTKEKKNKKTNNNLQNATQKSNDQVTRNPPKTEGALAA
jgi:hypothetical protein